jgi:hypothetical protein
LLRTCKSVKIEASPFLQEQLVSLDLANSPRYIVDSFSPWPFARPTYGIADLIHATELHGTDVASGIQDQSRGVLREFTTGSPEYNTILNFIVKCARHLHIGCRSFVHIEVRRQPGPYLKFLFSTLRGAMKWQMRSSPQYRRVAITMLGATEEEARDKGLDYEALSDFARGLGGVFGWGSESEQPDEVIEYTW